MGDRKALRIRPLPLRRDSRIDQVLLPNPHEGLQLFLPSTPYLIDPCSGVDSLP